MYGDCITVGGFSRKGGDSYDDIFGIVSIRYNAHTSYLSLLSCISQEKVKVSYI